MRGRDYSDEDSETLIREMVNRLGAGMKVVLEFVDEIKRCGRGKFRWVISKVPLSIK